MLPVWLMRGRVIIGISSPKGRNNFFAKLFFSKYPDTKEAIFNTLVFTGSCAKCTSSGKSDTCYHEPWRFPSYLEVNTKMEAIRLTMDQDVTTFNQEQKGIITEDAKGAYVPFKYIERLKATPKFNWKGKQPPPFVVVAMDPNSSGPNDTSITALAPSRGETVVVGLDSQPCEDPRQIATLFRYFIEGLYKHPWLSKSIFVLLVERNITAGPYVVEQIMSEKYPRHFIVTDKVRNISGYWTDRKMKVEYVVSGSNQMREDKISFLTDMVCRNPWLDADTRADMMIQKVLEQIPRFRLKDPPIGSNGLPKLSGKFDENGKEVKGAKDDMAFTMFMALYMLEGILKETIPGLDYNYIRQQGL